MLLANAGKAPRERPDPDRVFEALRGLGYEGGYDAVRRYAKGWRRTRTRRDGPRLRAAVFAPGEAYQFDWSHEIVLIGGVTVTVKVAHVGSATRACLFVRAYPRESQEMVFDAHDRAFAFFRGTCQRGIYDNMKTAGETIFVGASAPTTAASCRCARTTSSSRWPARPHQGGRRVSREPGRAGARAPVHATHPGEDYDELNAQLLDGVIAFAKAHPHPRRGSAPCGERFEGRAGGAGALCRPASTASTPCRPASPRPASYALTTTLLGGRLSHRPSSRVRAMPRASRSARTAASSPSNPCLRPQPDGVRSWHYVPCSPAAGALRNGAPFKDWVLPAALDRVRRKLAGSADGDRQMVEILTAVLGDGLLAVEAACARRCARACTRRRHPEHPGSPARAIAPVTLLTPEGLRLRHEPVADCARYDSLRRAP